MRPLYPVTVAPHPTDSLRSVPCTRRTSWLLALSLLPMLTFLGHWTVDLPIPGTDFHVALPLVAHHPHTDHEAHGGHDQHCHGDSASCSNTPAGPVSVAMLGEYAALLAGDGWLEWLDGRHWEPSSSQTIAPERTPPRPAL